ncbi:MAG: cAMP-binding proteins - catabolite gene activator and regulatory subunit of cAMP-dependent protein kinases [uncultured Thermomicrobiales bacterium]|uniref:cAMP-binding proteins - catabolite gene activator and regulatory subunit of cAMP-dependent protein kinases n=1 Tax=uncultured Thermomicrobiales bacterium TaxID=1645740 RepID=A0A6J4UNN7_9BACT|nr:MAG: cAMP-binding proteins - catabolite gene activator and regulatory subunit of cAMP-dependent protein kinases [uncultured Thermomicrobiales bacterium]
MFTSPRAPQAADPQTSQLLAALPAEEYAALRPYLELVELPNGAPIYAPGETPRHVYFPLTGSGSVVVSMASGDMVEAGTIGREGLIGLAAFLGTDAGPLTTIAQVPGTFAQLPVAVFRDAAPGSHLHTLLLRFTQAFYVLAAQSAGCNRLHPIEGRCARWLLLTHDRAAGDSFRLTHEYLGYMLGVRRPSVTLAARILQREGLITYHRGDITILDRPGLEAAACECYAIIAAEYARLLGAP